MTVFKLFDKTELCDEMRMISENMDYANTVLSKIPTEKELDTIDLNHCISLIKNVKAYADMISS